MAARTARLEHDWWHTANLMCLTANINRGKGKPASKPVEFHPFARRKTPPRQATPEELKALFGPNWAQVQTS